MSNSEDNLDNPSQNAEEQENIEDSFMQAFKVNFIFQKQSNDDTQEDSSYSQYFITKAETDIINKIFVEKKQKRGNFGRRKKTDNKNPKKGHTRCEEYNSISKAKIHSIDCLTGSVNAMLDFYGHDNNERFLEINAEFKRKMSKEELEKLKKMKLRDIIIMKIKGSYKKKPLDHNKKLYEKIEKNPNYKVIIDFLNENFLYFFQNVYYPSERKISLKKYKVNDIIPLTDKVELYVDKLNSNSFNDGKDDEEYKQLYNKYVIANFISSKYMFQIE